MADGDVSFLDPGRSFSANRERLVTVGVERFPRSPGQANSLASKSARLLSSLDHIWRLAAGADGYQNIAGRCQREYLTGKNLFITIVIAKRSER